MIVDNSNSNFNRFFFSGSSVWRSDNIRADPPIWREIKVNPIINPGPNAQKPIRVSAAAQAPSNPDILWVAEFDPITSGIPNTIRYGRLYKTENATAISPEPTPVSWTTIDDNSHGRSPLPNRQILKILIDKNNANLVYVGLGGAEEDNLWRTTNGGANWTNITGGDLADCSPDVTTNGLPCVPINAIERDPVDPKKIYVGTDIGIYFTKDVNRPNPDDIIWTFVPNGPANVKISDLNYLKGSNTLLAATYGRGLWTLDLGPTPQPTQVDSKGPINDFDGDGRSDLAVVREDSAHKDWHIQGSSEAYRSQEFGNRDDQVAAADYDGDGKTDVAVYRGSEQKFYCLRSSDNTLAVTQINAQNAATAQTAVGDFDGDDLADEAVFDAYTGHWTVEQSSEGHLEFNWGEPNDTAVAADFNDDGQADFGVYREASGMITLSYNANGEAFQKQFGLEGDVPVPGEYDGDSKIDLAVWRADDDGEGNGCWYITYAANGYEGFDAIPWGVSGDVPVPGDYDGDGKLDIAVFRPSTGMWHILQSSNGYYSERFGADGDKPVGVKAVYASRGAGNGTFTKAPSWAEPKRRVEKPRIYRVEAQREH